MSPDFIQSFSLEVFKETKSYALVLFPIFFLLRLIHLNISGASAQSYGQLFKNTIVFLALLISYEYFLSLSFEFSNSLKGSQVLTQAKDRILHPESSGALGLSFIRKALGFVSSITYYLAQGLFLVALVFISALAPLIFLFGTLLSMPSLIQVFYFILLIGSFWPLLFAAFDRVGFVLLEKGLQTEGSLYPWVVDLLIELFKLAGPLTIIKLLLGTSFGQSLSSTVVTGFRISKSAANAFTSFGTTQPQTKRQNGRYNKNHQGTANTNQSSQRPQSKLSSTNSSSSKSTTTTTTHSPSTHPPTSSNKAFRYKNREGSSSNNSQNRRIERPGEDSKTDEKARKANLQNKQGQNSRSDTRSYPLNTFGASQDSNSKTTDEGPKVMSFQKRNPPQFQIKQPLMWHESRNLRQQQKPLLFQISSKDLASLGGESEGNGAILKRSIHFNNDLNHSESPQTLSERPKTSKAKTLSIEGTKKRTKAFRTNRFISQKGWGF